MAEMKVLEAEARKDFNRKKPGRFHRPKDSKFWDTHCVTFLGLKPIPSAERMFGGSCPFCGGDSCFVVWMKERRVHCYRCGLDGKIVG